MHPDADRWEILPPPREKGCAEQKVPSWENGIPEVQDPGLGSPLHPVSGIPTQLPSSSSSSSPGLPCNKQGLPYTGSQEPLPTAVSRSPVCLRVTVNIQVRSDRKSSRLCLHRGFSLCTGRIFSPAAAKILACFQYRQSRKESLLMQDAPKHTAQATQQKHVETLVVSFINMQSQKLLNP